MTGFGVADDGMQILHRQSDGAAAIAVPPWPGFVATSSSSCRPAPVRTMTFSGRLAISQPRDFGVVKTSSQVRRKAFILSRQLMVMVAALRPSPRKGYLHRSWVPPSAVHRQAARIEVLAGD